VLPERFRVLRVGDVVQAPVQRVDGMDKWLPFDLLPLCSEIAPLL
jgi:hypothetical protein